MKKKEKSTRLFSDDDDSDLDQFRQLEEAIQQESSSSSDIFPNPEKLRKKFPNLFAKEDNQNSPLESLKKNKLSLPSPREDSPISPIKKAKKKNFKFSSSSDDDNDNYRKPASSKKYLNSNDNDQMMQLTNDLHQAFKLVTQKKAELDREQQRFLKEKHAFAREKAKYESEQIFADTEANSASYLLLNQKYKALKEKYKFKKSEWDKEKQRYISQIEELKKKVQELMEEKTKRKIKDTYISSDDSDDKIPDSIMKKSKVNNTNNKNTVINEVIDKKIISTSPKYSSVLDDIDNFQNPKQEKMALSDDQHDNEVIDEDNYVNENPTILSNNENNTDIINQSNKYDYKQNQEAKFSQNEKSKIPEKKNRYSFLNEQKNKSPIQSSNYAHKEEIYDSSKSFSFDDEINDVPIVNHQIKGNKFSKMKPQSQVKQDNSSLKPVEYPPLSTNYEKPLQVFRAIIPKSSPSSDKKVKNQDSPTPSTNTKRNTSNASPFNDVSRLAQINQGVEKNPTNKYSPISNAKNQNSEIIRANIPKRLSTIQLESPKKTNFSGDYDINFDVNFGKVIETKPGPNQKKIIKYFDGTVETVFSNGTRKIIRSNCTYVFYPNGDASQDFPDGARAYRYENGAVDLTLPSGIILYTFPNGQKEKHFPDGHKEIHYTTGEIKYLEPNGDYKMKYPDGKIDTFVKGKLEVQYS